jgi:hypothetical protein
MLRCVRFLTFLFFLAAALPANAIPIVHTVQPGGSGTATAQIAGTTTVLGSFTLPTITGTVTIESADQKITDFDLSFGSTALTAIHPGYGGYDRVQVNSLTLSPGPGYAATINTVIGTSTQMTVGPVAATSVYSSSDSTSVHPPANNVPLNFEAGSMTAIVTSGGATSIVLTGIPVALINPTALTLPSPETNNLIVLGQFTFSALAVPEPSTGALMFLGLSGLVTLGSRHRQRGR